MILPQWASNVSYLLANKLEHGGDAWLNCHRCKTREPLAMARIILKAGPLWSPWNRRPKCPKCGDQMLINGQWSEKAFVIPFITQDPLGLKQVDDLHRAWKREQRRERGYSEPS